MNSKLLAPILVSTLALSGAIASTAQAQIRVGDPTDTITPTTPITTGTTFYCVNSGQNFATVAERNGVRTAPIFVWQTTEFGRDYTPGQRCNLVTQRLNSAVGQNGGRLRNLLLTTGRVNRLPVVCYVNSDRTGCNSQNLLFTLDSRNARNPDAALQRLLQFGVEGSGDPIVSLVPTNPIGGSRLRRGYYSLNTAVEQAFNAVDDEDESPAPVQPSRPSNPFNGGI